MGIFKKKVENPNELLADVIAELLRSANLTIGDILSESVQKKIGVSIPIPAMVRSIDISREIATLIANKIKSEAALEALKKIKDILNEYKL